MSRQGPLPKLEAVVQVRLPRQGWKISLDIDPILIPVELGLRGRTVADVYDPSLIGLIDGLAALDDTPTEYRLVWSAGFAPVLGMCPLCDLPFPVSDGFPGDELNEGVNAVCCGSHVGQHV